MVEAQYFFFLGCFWMNCPQVGCTERAVRGPKKQQPALTKGGHFGGVHVWRRNKNLLLNDGTSFFFLDGDGNVTPNVKFLR